MSTNSKTTALLTPLRSAIDSANESGSNEDRAFAAALTTGIPLWETALNDGAMSPDELSEKLLDLSSRIKDLAHAVTDVDAQIPD